VPATAPDDVLQGVVLTPSNTELTSTRALGVPTDIRELVRARGMTRPTPARAAGRTVVHLVLWAGLSALGLLVGGLVWLPVWVLQGYFLQSAYSGLHDAIHHSQYRSKQANRVAAVLWGLPLLLNGSLWRAWHLEHHRATATSDDPEPHAVLGNRLIYAVAFPVGGLAMFAGLWAQSVGSLFGRPPKYVRRRGAYGAIRVDAAIVLLATVLGVVGLVRATFLTAALWFIPFAVYWCVISVGVGLSEHYGTSKSGGQLDVTRSVTTKRFMRFMQWNSNFHAAHHLVPSVSYTFLPELDAALGDRVRHRSGSYVAFHAGQLRMLSSDPRSVEVPQAT
jgi:fatty acid desaturase